MNNTVIEQGIGRGFALHELVSLPCIAFELVCTLDVYSGISGIHRLSVFENSLIFFTCWPVVIEMHVRLFLM